MDAHEAEELPNSMMLNSPLPDAEWGDKRLPEDDGSNKLPEEESGEKLPEGVDENLSEETPTGKLIVPYIDKVLPFSLSLVL